MTGVIFGLSSFIIYVHDRGILENWNSTNLDEWAVASIWRRCTIAVLKIAACTVLEGEVST